MELTPVMLPPGRFRLATRPSWTGSKPMLKTIGIVVVAALAASAVAELRGVAMTAPAAYEIGHQFRNSGKVVLCPAVFNCYVLTLDVAGFTQSFAERCQQTRHRLWRIRMDISDDGNGWLPRARRERPKKRRRDRGAADKRDELAALHSITLSARRTRPAGTSCPIALAVFRLITSSNVVGCSTGRSAGFAPLRILATIRAR